MTAMHARRSRRTILGSCAVLAVAGLVAGCGGDDDKPDAAETAPSKPANFAITASAEGETRKAMTFPSSVKSGLVTMTLTNSDTVPRSAQLLRIVGDHSVDEVLEVVTGDGEEIPAWVQDGGGVPTVKPGATASATQVLVPGRYVLVDDEEGEAEGGEEAKSHGELGAAGEFQVTGERSRARLPRVAATITAEDATEGKKKTYGFRLEGLRAGTNEVHFQNTGAELHHALFFPLRKGATLQQVERFFTSRTPSGPSPIDFGKVVGTKVIDAGIEQNVTLDLPAARYAVICFVTDREGGKSHVEKGMLEEVTVE